MKIRHLVILLSCLVSSPLLQAQMVTKKTADEKAKRLYTRGNQYVINDLDDKAISDFEKAIQLEPQFIDAHIQLAQIYAEKGKNELAEKKYEEVIAISDDYYPMVLYSLAIQELKLKKEDEAILHFEKFLSKKTETEKLNAKAQSYVDNIKFRKKALANPVPFEPIPLGAGINTSHWEYLPALTIDEETLVFTRRILPPSRNPRAGNEDFYLSHFIDGKWTEARPIKTINSPNTNEGAQAISADGKLLVYTLCSRKDGYGDCDLYYSRLKSGIWSASKNLGNSVNTSGWDSQPSISADNKSIYFASERGGGQGGSDIWVSQRKSGGTFQKPVNLGSKINTPGEEQSPFIHPDGQTLYFMSKGHPGMGNMDIFCSRRQEDGNWGEPFNLGYPINSSGHDGFFIVSSNGRFAYLGSDRIKEGGEKGDLDIYKFELYPEARPKPVTYVKANVIDAATEKPIKSIIKITDLKSEKDIHFSYTDSEGIFLVCLPAGKLYGLNVSKEGYLFHSENFALENSKADKDPYKLTIRLQAISDEKTAPAGEAPAIVKEEIPKRKPIILKNVFFESASAELKKESTTELNSLVDLLDKNSSLKIQINGHTDDVGEESDNQFLSELRAKAVHDFLIESGVEASRLKYAGYGEQVPVDSNETEEGRQNNRRTEFVII